jgi:hypothetical protein
MDRKDSKKVELLWEQVNNFKCQVAAQIKAKHEMVRGAAAQQPQAQQREQQNGMRLLEYIHGILERGLEKQQPAREGAAGGSEGAKR